jgi:soluble lytic murein transglycosylase-like protein
MHVESANRPQARSPKGALGLMQIMPATGARYGVKKPQDLLDPATNIDVGTRYLRDLHQLFDGQMELVLAAYNAGEGAVKRHGNRIPPYRETQDYVRKVLRLYRDR